MRINNTHKYIIKLVIIALSYGYICYRLLQYDNIDESLSFISIDFSSLIFLFTAFLLMPVNWGLEGLKWKHLISKLERISLLSSFLAVMAGITVSIFTPNRIGEFGGRIFILKKENRISGIFSTITGSISQLLITIVVGLFASIIFMIFFPDAIIFSTTIYYSIIGISVILSAALIILYFNIKIISRLCERIRFLRKYTEQAKILARYKRKDLAKVLFLSLIRYCIFIVQFFLMLRFFGVEIGMIEAFLCICVIYLFMTVVPSIAIAEFGIRGSIAIAVISVFSDQTTAILAATLTLWVINLVVPALLGSVIFYRFKL